MIELNLSAKEAIEKEMHELPKLLTECNVWNDLRKCTNFSTHHNHLVAQVRLIQVYENLSYEGKLQFLSAKNIDQAFTWSETENGLDFWQDVNDTVYHYDDVPEEDNDEWI